MIIPWTRGRTTYLDIYTGSVGGDYYIGVQSGSAQGSGMYVLVAEEVDVPDGSRTNVTLPLEEWYLSFYNSSYDQDVYRVHLKADRRYTILATKLAGGSTETFQWSQVNNIDGVCNSRGCFTSTETDGSILDYFHKFPRDRSEEDEASKRGLPWAVAGDSSLVEFSVKTDGEYLIRVVNYDETDGSPVKKGAYRLRISDWSADPPPTD